MGIQTVLRGVDLIGQPPAPRLNGSVRRRLSASAPSARARSTPDAGAAEEAEPDPGSGASIS
jgi:hypothetical protein